VAAPMLAMGPALPSEREGLRPGVIADPSPGSCSSTSTG
jgi:hypothetical protein